MPIPVLSGIGDALDFYQRNLHNPLSGSLLLGLNRAKMGLGLGDQGSQDMADNFGSGMPGSDPSGALNSAFRDNPLGRFAYDTATDPLTYLGTGLFPAAAKAAGMGGRALGAVGALDSLPGRLTGTALDAAGQVLGGPAKAAASAVEPYMAGFADKHQGLADAWTQTNRMWKELNHDIPGYPLGNMVDDASRSAAFGDTTSARQMIQGFPGAIKATFAGASDPAGIAAQQRLLTGGATNAFLDTMGGDLSHAITDTGVASSGPESAFRRYQSSIPQYDSMGNRVGDQYVVNGPKDWLVDKLSGLGEKNKLLEQNQEMVTRGPVWGNAATKGVSDRMDNMAQWLDQNGASGATLNDFIDSHGMMAPSELTARLQSEGMHPGTAQSAGESWQRAVGDAAQGADDWTNKTQFQYRNNPIGDAAKQWSDNYGYDLGAAHLNPRTASVADLKNAFPGIENTTALPDWERAMQGARAEQVMRSLAQNTFGGYKFGTQNVPTYLRLAGEHPGLANAPAEYYRDSDIYNAQHGLPASFHGSMPIGTNPLNGDQMYFNPMRLSSMGELMGGATGGGSDSGDTALGSAVHTLGDLSLGVNPIIKTALQLTGQMGDNQMSDTLRPLTLLSGAGSLISGHPMDLEQPFKAAVGMGEQALTGKETSPFQGYLVRKRTAELSPSGNQWNATQDHGPANDQAISDVAQRQGISSLLRTLSPLDLQSVTPEAARIGQNQMMSNVNASRGLLHTAGNNPTAQMYQLADPLAEKVARFETLPVDERMALLRDPRALQMLQQERMIKLHNPQALAAG